jgi:hypothetical protein
MFFRKREIVINKHIESEAEESKRKCFENWEEILKVKGKYNKKTGRIEIRS